MNIETIRERLRGAFVAAVTPMTPSGEVDHEGLTRNLRWYASAGLSGVLLLGSTGEQPLLSEFERALAMEVARREMGREQVLIAGVGQQGTRLTIAECRRAAEAGADVALAVTPNYYQNAINADALTNHYRAIAEASPIPLLLYSVPGVTNITIPPPVVAALATHPNVVGMKNSGSDPRIAMAYREAAGTAPFLILSGSVQAAPGQLLLGQADGVILGAANVLPETSVALVASARCGDVAATRRHGETLCMAADTIGRFGISGWKAGIAARGYHGGPVRSPLRDITEQERALIAGWVNELVAR